MQVSKKNKLQNVKNKIKTEKAAKQIDKILKNKTAFFLYTLSLRIKTVKMCKNTIISGRGMNIKGYGCDFFFCFSYFPSNLTLVNDCFSA